MTRYIPKDILTEFFRAEMTDPRGRHSTDTVTFSGDGSTKEFTFSSVNMKAITSVTVGGTSKNKWEDYKVDIKAEKIIFDSAPPTGTDNITANIKKGSTSWIYPDTPREDLTSDSYPRIGFQIITTEGVRNGTYKASIEDRIRVQTDIYTVRGQVFTINNNQYEGDKLAEILGYILKDKIINEEAKLHPTLYDFGVINGPRSADWDREHQAFHSIVEFQIKGINTGVDL